MAGERPHSTSPSYVVVGHVTLDQLPIGRVIGGTVSFAGLTAARLGLSAGAVTSAGSDLDPRAELPEIQWAVRPSHATTVFENVYQGGTRTQWLIARGDDLRAIDVPLAWRAPRIAHLAPLTRELGPDMYDAFRDARLIGLTPQGWIRTWDSTGRVRAQPAQVTDELLGRADVIMLSEEDVDGDWRVLRRFADAVGICVVTQGDRGCTVLTRGSRVEVPAFRAVETDATGAGDVFAAAYLIRIDETGDPIESARFANCVASFAIEGPSVSAIPSRERVEERLLAGEIRPRLGAR